jgi:hypothetical protein
MIQHLKGKEARGNLLKGAQEISCKQAVVNRGMSLARDHIELTRKCKFNYLESVRKVFGK